jgi:hypothetical protein
MFALRHHARRTCNHGRRSLYDWARPQTCSRGRQNRQTKLDDFKPYLHERWTEGCTNAWDPWEEIKTHGYTDAIGAVRAYLQLVSHIPGRTGGPSGAW